MPNGLTFSAPAQQIDDGLDWNGYIQPPSVPPDPIGNDWRGPPGPPGPGFPEAPLDGVTYGRVSATWTGVLPLTGGVLSGGITVARDIVIDGGATGPAQLFLDSMGTQQCMIVGRTDTSTRWVVQPGDTTAESGSNAGSNFSVARYSDAGSFIDNPLAINRATGVVDFSQNPTVAGLAIGTGYAPLASPVFTGSPSLPAGTTGVTAAPGDNDNSLATTGFVAAAVAGATAGVASFNSRTGIVTLLNADVTTVLPPSSTTPPMDGTAAVGTGTTWARADHVHPSDTSRYAATNPSGFQTAPQVTTAVQAAVRYSNYANNTGFSVNQRAYATGAALAAGAFGHDRWKAGAGGCTYTFTQSPGPSTTVTITAGTLQQVIEGASLVGGNYILSWVGTAQGRVGAGSYAASPVSVAGITAGANTTIEFNAGSLGQVKMEAGTVATAWVPLPARDELSDCQRFFQVVAGSARVNGAGVISAGAPVSWPQMRATPAVTLNSAGTRFNISSPSLTANTPFAGLFGFASSGAGDAYVINELYNLTADI